MRQWPNLAPSSRGKRLAFRLVTLFGIPLALLAFIECTLRICGYGYSPGFFLHHVESAQSIWTENPDFGRRFFPPGLQRASQPFRFADPKPPGTLRVFVLGESAAMGDPDFKFGLPRMLKVLLRERFPDRRIEVINAAVVAINSHVIRLIAEDCTRRQGDLWLIYMGNNEVVGPFGSASVFGSRAPAWPVVRAGLWLKTTRLGQLFDSTIYSLRRGSRSLPEWRGMEMMAHERISRRSRGTQAVYSNFRRNLADILEAGCQAPVPIVLCTMPANFRDCAPFASLHRSGLSVDELAKWQTAYDSGMKEEQSGNLTNALALYAKAAELDSEFAELAFHRAQIAERLGLNQEAVNHYRAALDSDALQFRADSAVNRAIRETASAFAQRGVTLLDADGLFATNSLPGSPGADFFYEHVHLTPEGNYLLARAAAEQAVKALNLKPSGAWLSQTECFRLVGLTDLNRFDAYATILDRVQSAPFTNQLNHAQQLAEIDKQLARYKPATKPAQAQRQATQLAQLVQQRPEDPDLLWNLASLLQNSGDYRGAEEQWRSLVALQPQAPLPAFNLARLLESLERPAEALPFYQQSLRYNADPFPARFACGRLCFQLGLFPQAIHHLKGAIREKPGSVEVHLTLAQAFSKAQQLTQSQNQWREVLRLDPGNAAANDALGLAKSKP